MSLVGTKLYELREPVRCVIHVAVHMHDTRLLRFTGVSYGCTYGTPVRCVIHVAVHMCRRGSIRSTHVIYTFNTPIVRYYYTYSVHHASMRYYDNHMTCSLYAY